MLLCLKLYGRIISIVSSSNKLLSFLLKLTSNSDNSGMKGELEDKRSGSTIAVKIHNFGDLVSNGEASGVIMLVSYF